MRSRRASTACSRGGSRRRQQPCARTAPAPTNTRSPVVAKAHSGAPTSAARRSSASSTCRTTTPSPRIERSFDKVDFGKSKLTNRRDGREPLRHRGERSSTWPASPPSSTRAARASGLRHRALHRRPARAAQSFSVRPSRPRCASASRSPHRRRLRVPALRQADGTLTAVSMPGTPLQTATSATCTDVRAAHGRGGRPAERRRRSAGSHSSRARNTIPAVSRRRALVLALDGGVA